MEKVTRIRTATTRTDGVPAMPPGLHAGVVEMKTKRAFRVRLASGEVVKATLGDGVSAVLVDACLRERRLVVVTPIPDGIAIVGALQTQPVQSSDEVSIAARSVEIDAQQAISLRAGKAKITLEKDGAIRITGDAATMRLAKALRVLAAKVELP